MKVVLTRAAARQLDDILDYITRRHPTGAQRVKARLEDVFRLLAHSPMSGPSTNRRGVRRMIATPYPYVVYYSVKASTVIVQRIRHAARRPIN